MASSASVGSHTDSITLMRNYGQLLRSRAFLGYAIGGGCSTTSGYAFIASAPFIFIDQLHRSAHEVGLYLAILVAGASLGVLLASRLVGRIPMQHLLLRANAASVLGAFVFRRTAAEVAALARRKRKTREIRRKRKTREIRRKRKSRRRRKD